MTDRLLSPDGEAEISREPLELVVHAAQRYRRAQRRRDQTYEELLEVIRRAAGMDSAPTLEMLSKATGLSTTRLNQILSRPISKRDHGHRFIVPSTKD